MLPPFGGALSKSLTLLDLGVHLSDMCRSGELVGEERADVSIPEGKVTVP